MISASSFTAVYALNINLNLGTTYTTINENNIENNNTTLTLAFYGNTTRINVAYNALKDNPNYTLITINNLENTTLQTIDILFIDIQTIQQEQINFTKTALTLWQMGKGFYVLGYHPQNTTEKYWSFSAAGILHNKTYFEYTINFGGQNENDPQRKSKFETVLIKSVENITRMAYDEYLHLVKHSTGVLYVLYDDEDNEIDRREAMIYSKITLSRVGDSVYAFYTFGWETIGNPFTTKYKCGWFDYAAAKLWCENYSSEPPWTEYQISGNARWWWEKTKVLQVPYHEGDTLVFDGMFLSKHWERRYYQDGTLVYVFYEEVLLSNTAIYVHWPGGGGGCHPPLIRFVPIPPWVDDIPPIPPP